MLSKQVAITLRIAVAITAIISFSGCSALIDGLLNTDSDSSSGGSSRSRGVPLSKAMESSASGDRSSLGGNERSSSSRGGGAGYYDSTDSSSSGGSGTSYYNSTDSGGGTAVTGTTASGEYEMKILVDASYLLPMNGDIRGITYYTLTLGAEDVRNMIGIYFGGGTVELESGSLPDLGSQNPWTLGTGFVYRRYLNGPKTFLSPYFALGAEINFMFWDYRNPVIAGGDLIESDSLAGVGGYVGLGVAVKRNDRLSLFTEVDFGGTVLVGETYQGFSNDVFDNYGYYMFRAGLSFKF